jgi:amino-acid N-acetyltransferase
VPDSIEVRKARLADIPAMASLINAYAAEAIMLPRTEFELAEGVRDFTVVYQDGVFRACGALHIYTADSGEIRSLAVDRGVKRGGLGRTVVEALEREAREFGLASLFAFTYVEGFFAKLGFAAVDRGELPLKAWKDCLRCPKFKACDEIAVRKQLQDKENLAPITPEKGVNLLPVLARTSAIEVPFLKG